MMKSTPLCLLTLALVGCGGGGDGNLVTLPAAATGAATDTAATEVIEQSSEPLDIGAANSGQPTASETTPVAAATAELNAAPSFDFQTQWEMAVDFNIAAARDKDGFLSICSSYEFDGESAYDVDFDSCAVRASISNGVFQNTINVTNDVEQLLAVIWFAEEFQPPLYSEFQLSNGQQQISWN